jgi:cold shock CspA family protein
MRVKGKIASWKDDKGYGLIAPFSGDSQVFVHIKAFRNRNRRPDVDDVVAYDVARVQA